MSNIRVNTTELMQMLEMIPASHNIMLVGRHGIGKSEILTEYYAGKGMKVVPLFLGQMADPGDLIGIPNKNAETGKTEFMPPYWFPLDGKPIVLFLDELNRARPEILQTIMDLALNRTLAGRRLPEGSRNLPGTSILVEIFDGRIEITNPGEPLVNIARIIDNPPKSRNEKLSSLMRRMDMCEELGSGWDRIVESCEAIQCRTPRIDVFEEHTRVVIFSKTVFSNMSIEDKLWSCYTHACVRFVEGKTMTNSSLRYRFGIPVSMASSISRLLKDAISNNLVKPLDPSAAPKLMQYVPVWA